MIPLKTRILLADDGTGLPPDAQAGSGLQGMAERASAIEGALDLRPRPEGGTIMRLDVPIDEEGLWYR